MPRLRLFGVVSAVLLSFAANSPAQEKKSYRIPDVDLKQQIIWGSTCEGPDGFWLAFGGQDQVSDVVPRTRIKVDGKWVPFRGEVGERDPDAFRDHFVIAGIAHRERDRLAHFRAMCFRGLAVPEKFGGHREDIKMIFKSIEQYLSRPHVKSDPDLANRALGAVQHFAPIMKRKSWEIMTGGNPIDALFAMTADVRDLEITGEMLDIEPAPRLVSPLAYDAKTKLFVLFGGDHGDYLMNDTWTFDPAKKQWMHRNPKTAPAPRGNHTLKANGDGTVTLSGGHYYTSNTDYVGGQYKQFTDGEWTYDIAADVWKGPAAGETPDIRVYRKGPFAPEFFWTGPAPDPKATSKTLAELPANRWVEMKDSHHPRMERTWGHAAFDPDGDRILVFGGGHSAHGGSDVLHFHLSTCRWELPFAVEFPLGQLYSNTSYPEGFNVNRRPWVTGHTYHNYNYDPVSKKMYFTGHHHECYVYDPDKGDWIGRIPKPKGMTYDSCFYTLNLVQTPEGLACWTGRGELFRLAGKDGWQPMPTTGAKLPTSAVDTSTWVHDSKRDRFLIFRGEYGKKFAGDIVAVDRKTGAATKIAPKNLAAYAGSGMTDPVDHAMYDPENDLVLFAAYLPGDPTKVRRTLAYDCGGDRWVSLNLDYAIQGKKALQPRGPGHSCGLMFDARRKLIWGCDTHECRVYAMRLDLKTADVRAIE